jgi:thioredoxin reductase
MSHTELTVYGTPWCSDCKRAKKFLGEQRVYVFIGLPPEVERDKAGFIVTKPTLETSLAGVFAAGDVRQGSTKQAASAAGEGATAALMIREYLNGM